MPNFLKHYYDTEGPFGLPMKDKQAKRLDAKLRTLPKDEAFEFRRLAYPRGLAELQAGERADVSWITAETPDRLGDVVLARGMDDSHFQLNPIVTLNHRYDQPPVGRSLWRRKVKEGDFCGVKAKTHYPPRPDNWKDKDWLPDYAFELVKADLLRGKSIGFFPLKVRTPTAEEKSRHSGWQQVRYVIEEWLLAEYACCFLPVQPHAVVEQVSKSLAVPEHILQLASAVPPTRGLTPPGSPLCDPVSSAGLRPRLAERAIAFTPWEQIEKALRRQLAAIDRRILEKSVELTLQKARGVV
jgi:hypothetical protein